MAKIESYVPGSFCWAELATNDAAAAKTFMARCSAGRRWTCRCREGVYTLFQSDGNDAAAVYAAPPEVPVHWGVYFSVASADESAAKIAPAGGKVIAGPFDAHDVGRMAVAQDPQGAMFSLWQAKKSIGATHGGPLSQVAWPELVTTGPRGSRGVLHQLFGWKTKPETGVAEAQYTEWVNGGRSIGGLMPMKGDEWQGVPPHWAMYSLWRIATNAPRARGQLGAKICVPPMDIPNVGRFAVIADPQGATFSIIHLTAIISRPRPEITRRQARADGRHSDAIPHSSDSCA